jgi:hypothetical protein
MGCVYSGTGLHHGFIVGRPGSSTEGHHSTAGLSVIEAHRMVCDRWEPANELQLHDTCGGAAEDAHRHLDLPPDQGEKIRFALSAF